jgi:glycosyltransferase involved in cell wall biosynthesis
LAPSSRLRVAHVTATFPPYAGGTGNVAWSQARELARRGHDVHVLTADLGGRAVAPEHVSVHRLRPLARFGNAPCLPALLKWAPRFDLIHLHYPFYFGAELIWLASRIYRVPYVVSYHNDVELSGHLRFVAPGHHRLIGRRILSDARRLLFTTLDYGRSSYAADLVERPTTDEVPNGVDTERFHAGLDGSSVRERYARSAADCCVLFVGGLDQPHYFKGVSVLLQALHRVPDPHVRLIIVGEGELRARYEQESASLGLADRVCFTGRVSDDELPKYYAAADVLVLPSVTRGEAFGLVLLEAMACGRPVLASDLPGVRHVVRNTGGGELVRAADADALGAAIARFAANPGLRQTLGRRGRMGVEQRYAWPSIAERLEAAYSAALHDRNTRLACASPVR